MEEQQELSEELDQHLDVIRKELDSSKIQIYERETVIQ
jgi:hypothetical protein